MRVKHQEVTACLDFMGELTFNCLREVSALLSPSTSPPPPPALKEEHLQPLPSMIKASPNLPFASVNVWLDLYAFERGRLVKL